MDRWYVILAAALMCWTVLGIFATERQVRITAAKYELLKAEAAAARAKPRRKLTTE